MAAGRASDHRVRARGRGAATARDRPYLVFLQGGPGFEATRPTRPPPPGLAGARAADYRVLLLDQRGTGRSTPVGAACPGARPQEQADVPDALPRRLDRARRRADPRSELGVERWSVLGQSFGGFCVDDLPVDRAGGPARGVHHRRPAADRPTGRRRLRARPTRAIAERNRRYFERYPGRPRAGARAPARALDARGRPAAVRRPADRAAACASSAACSG